MARPGVMFYFDIRPCLKRLDAESKGKLFEAILDYGEYGIMPEFEGMLGIAWDFIQPRVDHDGDRYQEKCENSKKAANIRWEKEREKKLQAELPECDCIPAMPTANTESTATSFSTRKTESETRGFSPESDVENSEEDWEERRKRVLQMLESWNG